MVSDVIAEALKAANITGPLPFPEPRKPKQARKPRTLKPLLKVEYKTDCDCAHCKITIADLKINHRVVYDRLYVKCKTRFDELQRALLQVTRERDYYKSQSEVLAKQLIDVTKERDYYKSHFGHFA